MGPDNVLLSDKKHVSSFLTDLVNMFVQLTGKTRIEIINAIHLHIPRDNVNRRILHKMILKEHEGQMIIEWPSIEGNELLIKDVVNLMIKLTEKKREEIYDLILTLSLLNEEQSQILVNQKHESEKLYLKLDICIEKYCSLKGATKLEAIRNIKEKLEEFLEKKNISNK